MRGFCSEFAVYYLIKKLTVTFMQQCRLNAFARDVCQTQTKLKDAVSEKALTDLKGNRVQNIAYIRNMKQIAKEEEDDVALYR